MRMLKTRYLLLLLRPEVGQLRSLPHLPERTCPEKSLVRMRHLLTTLLLPLLLKSRPPPTRRPRGTPPLLKSRHQPLLRSRSRSLLPLLPPGSLSLRRLLQGHTSSPLLNPLERPLLGSKCPPLLKIPLGLGSPPIRPRFLPHPRRPKPPPYLLRSKYLPLLRRMRAPLPLPKFLQLLRPHLERPPLHLISTCLPI